MNWFLCVSVILMSTFAGQLKASITFKPSKPRIESLLDLYRSGHAVYIAREGATQHVLQVSFGKGIIRSLTRKITKSSVGSRLIRLLLFFFINRVRCFRFIRLRMFEAFIDALFKIKPMATQKESLVTTYWIWFSRTRPPLSLQDPPKPRLPREGARQCLGASFM